MTYPTDTDITPSWNSLFRSPVRALVTDIELDLWDPEILYISFASGGSRSDKIVRFDTTIVPTASDPTKTEVRLVNQVNMTPVTSSFPADVVVFSIASHILDNDVIFTGTNRGVYRGETSDDGNKWRCSQYNNGLPRATHVSDLEIHPTSGTLRAGTLGRGAYSARLTFSSDVEMEEVYGKVIDLVVDPPPFPPPPIGRHVSINLVIKEREHVETKLEIRIPPNQVRDNGVSMIQTLQHALMSERKLRLKIERVPGEVPILRKAEIAMRN